MQDINIRKATAKDLSQLQKISKQTFFETFASHNTAENMNRYLAEAFTEEKLRAELINPEAAFYLAELDGAVLGYLKLNFGQAQTELKDKKALEIERIYVLQEFQGKRVGQLLYEKAIEMAKQQNIDYVWLGVWEENNKAIQFYKKNGFVAFDKHLFKLGDDEQVDIMMKLPIKE